MTAMLARLPRSPRYLGALVALQLIGWPVGAQSPSSVIVQDATDRFVFHSGFWINLHHSLYARARLRRGFDTTRVSVRGARGDTLGFGALPQALRDDWNGALTWYLSHLAERDILFNRDMNAISAALARVGSAATLPVGEAIDSSLAQALERAAPAYRALWWPRDDRANRAWVEALSPILRAHAAGLAERLEGLYHAPWIPGLWVDLVAYANWAGAYTTIEPGRVTMGVRAEGNAGIGGLESLFHEASHTMNRGLNQSLRAAAAAQGRDLPSDFPHTIIFYTAGELVRQLDPAYVPYAERYDMWTGVAGWSDFRALLRKEWQPFLDGRTDYDHAIDRLIQGLAP